MNFKGPPPEPSQHGDAADIAAGPCFGARHVAIIMDGNGRWAKSKNLPRAMGHKKGVEAVRKLVREAGEIGLETLTLYAFSSENWNRPAEEVNDLMGLLKLYIRSDLNEFIENDVRLRVIGDYKSMDPDIVKLIDNALERTADNQRMTVVVALNYGAQDELVRSARMIAQKVKNGELEPGAIDAQQIEENLDTADLPPLDLLIRTSGEVRLSNFLLWQSAYAELYFTDVLWPDFTIEHLQAALAEFGGRERRYGGR